MPLHVCLSQLGLCVLTWQNANAGNTAGTICARAEPQEHFCARSTNGCGQRFTQDADNGARGAPPEPRTVSRSRDPPSAEAPVSGVIQTPKTTAARID